MEMTPLGQRDSFESLFAPTDAALSYDTSNDPETNTTKLIIEKVFGGKFTDSVQEKQKAEENRKNQDSVEISQEAMALYYKRESLDIKVEDGKNKIEIKYERETIAVTQEVQKAEPIVLDLNNNGLELTDVTKGEGVNFDIKGDGKKVNVSWVKPGDGFLVLDKNNNGVIDSGKELFGDQNGAANGFLELAKYDSDSNSLINSKDSIFSKLSVWQDFNRNGLSEKSELNSLSSFGISSISLTPDNTRNTIAGNDVYGYSAFETAFGTRKAGEVFLNFLA
jgi:hypothetical protein